MGCWGDDVLIWDRSKHLSFDFETFGELPEYALQPWRVGQGKAWATSLAFVRRDPANPLKMQAGGGLRPTRDTMKAFLEDCILHGRRAVGWNVVFDIAWFIAYGLEDLVMQVKWLDGMLLWKHYAVEPEYEMTRGQRKTFGLKTCVAELWPDKAGYEEDIDFGATDPEGLAKLHRYNIRDCIFTLDAAEHWWNLLTERQQRCALIEAECLPLVAKANWQGMIVDLFTARHLEAVLTAQAELSITKLAPLGMTEEIVRSPAKLAELMFDNWGLEPLKLNVGKKTGKVSRSTDKETLYELGLDDPRVAEINLYREALNQRTKFATAPIEAADYNADGCVHPMGWVFSTYTGRITYSSKQGKGVKERPIGFAIHQEKRDKEFREILLPPNEYDLAEWDAASQEYKWMAIQSRDPTMLSLCLPGEDPHSYMTASIYGEDYKTFQALVETEDTVANNKRKGGKVANLSLQFRTYPKTLCRTARVIYNIDMTIAEAEHIHKTYLRTYRNIPTYWNRQIHNTKSKGYVETLAGRRVAVVGDWTGRMSWSMGSTAINYPIQGTGADQKYLALAAIKQYLRENGGVFGWDMHDGIYAYLPVHKSKKMLFDVKRILDALPYKRAWGFDPPIPLTWDCKLGPSWGMLKKMKEAA